MYKILISSKKNANEYAELVKMFLRPDTFEIIADVVENIKSADDSESTYIIDTRAMHTKDDVKRLLYDELTKATKKKPPYGILTGVRPVKLFGEIASRKGSAKEAEQMLAREYYLSPEKIKLLRETFQVQKRSFNDPKDGLVGLYIGIPFCPTRCQYCSFPSNQVKYEKIPPYLEALYKEMDAVSEIMDEIGWKAESIYIGGGTPTTLNAEDLKELLRHTTEKFYCADTIEFTVEAGRPDTIDVEKAKIMQAAGVSRVSINPQTMNDETLKTIGRDHKAADVKNAFGIIRNADIPVINADIIAGLPGETTEDFIKTVSEMVKLHPENLTVHCLATKRASKLIESDPEYHYAHGEMTENMLNSVKDIIANAGYEPYYLYRQKHMAGNGENVGYAMPSTENYYNVRIMEENQTIIALGAGASTKLYFPKENRLERIFNVTNYEIYIDRIDEMIDKKKGLKERC